MHTPGPWKNERLRDHHGNPYSTMYECHVDLGPCMIWCPEGDVEQEANARLIAETPEMFKVVAIIANATGNTDLECAQELSQEILMRLKLA